MDKPSMLMIEKLFRLFSCLTITFNFVNMDFSLLFSFTRCPSNGGTTRLPYSAQANESNSKNGKWRQKIGDRKPETGDRMILFSGLRSSVYSLHFSFIPQTLHPDAGISADRHHSYLKASTGFAVAARIACQLTVSSAIIKAKDPDSTNIHQRIFIR